MEHSELIFVRLCGVENLYDILRIDHIIFSFSTLLWTIVILVPRFSILFFVFQARDISGQLNEDFNVYSLTFGALLCQSP